MLGFGTEIQIGQTHLKYVPEEEAVEVAPLETERFGALVGRDPKMRQLFRLIGDIAGTDTTVLIEGETGTGKELFAEEIHRASPRRDGPFVVFDCGAVPGELIESALFGHVRGAFTGAIADRRGAFAEADGGTLFLDEIGELALELQPALLRALDKRAVRPVGGQAAQNFSVRVVAATNRDLRAEVAARRFREDLYYRLAVFRLAVPAVARAPRRCRRCWPATSPTSCPAARLHRAPERSRAAVAPRLSGQRARAAQPGRAGLRPVPGRHRWTSRGSEARGRIRTRAAAGPHDAWPGGGGLSTCRSSRPRPRWSTSSSAHYLERLLEQHQHNLSAASRAAELDRKHLRELLRKHGLKGGDE